MLSFWTDTYRRLSGQIHIEESMVRTIHMIDTLFPFRIQLQLQGVRLAAPRTLYNLSRLVEVLQPRPRRDRRDCCKIAYVNKVSGHGRQDEAAWRSTSNYTANVAMNQKPYHVWSHLIYACHLEVGNFSSVFFLVCSSTGRNSYHGSRKAPRPSALTVCVHIRLLITAYSAFVFVARSGSP